jgi:hypothetical protein
MTLSLQAKKALIQDHEKTMAEQLALRVVDKPVPPIWMVFVPIFFVFFASKMTQYKNGLRDFTKHYLISRHWALDAAAATVADGGVMDLEAVLQRAEDISAGAMPLYRSWLSFLAEHYQLLLSASADSYPALVRSAYRNKSSYLLFCDRLTKAENALNLALLPETEENRQELEQVVAMMTEGIKDLRRQELETIFA